MNSDSTVSADQTSADAEGAPEQSPPAPVSPPRSDAAADPVSGEQTETAAGETSVPEADPAEISPQTEPVAAEQTGDRPEDPPRESPPADDPPDETLASPVTAAPEAPAGDASTPASDETADPEKRRVRLNPKLDGGEARAVPSVRDAPATVASAVAETAPPAERVTDDVQSTEPAAAAPPPPPAAPVDVPEGDTLDAEMEAEIAAALESGEIGIAGGPGEPSAEVEQAAEAAADEAAPPTEDDIAEGAKLNGVIQSIHEDNVFLDFGLRQSGVVSKRQFGPKKEPKVGDKLEVVVTKVDEDEGLIVCSLPRGAARIAGDWDAVAVGQTVECMVAKTNKGGLEVTVSSLRGFMPASQVDVAYVSDLAPFVGQKLTARVTEVNPRRRRLVLSRRALLAEERAEQEAELLSQIEVGQTRTGRVKTIKDYGAFIDLGGMDGFLHIGQMSWTRIENPAELLSEGQDVEVKVLTIEPDKKDPDKKRIGLGMRQLIANPWSNVEDKFPKGSTQTGKVTRTENYGAFVELEPGVEGLVHISELDHQRVKRVTEVLNVGQQTEVQVLEVDRRRKRISLSVKALTAAPEAETVSDEDLAPGGGQPYERKRKDDLKGGIGGETPGGLFGNPSDFS